MRATRRVGRTRSRRTSVPGQIMLGLALGAVAVAAAVAGLAVWLLVAALIAAVVLNTSPLDVLRRLLPG